MFSDFLDLVRTESEREVMIREIDEVVNSNYKVNQEDSLQKILRAETLTLFESAKAKEKNYLGFLKALRQMLLDLTSFELTLAIDPTDELVNEIYSWVKMNVKKPIILAFKKKSTLIGGAEVSYLGNYYSFTVDHVLEEVLNGEPNHELLVVNKQK